MNKPPPPIKPKPFIKSTNLENINKLIETNDLKNDKSNDNVLDKNQLTKAFQLLNQKNNLNHNNDDTKYDMRIDEEQVDTFNQIIKNLFDAGYLRANIIGLSEFDKVILIMLIFKF